MHNDGISWPMVSAIWVFRPNKEIRQSLFYISKKWVHFVAWVSRGIIVNAAIVTCRYAVFCTKNASSGLIGSKKNKYLHAVYVIAFINGLCLRKIHFLDRFWYNIEPIS